MVSEIRQSLSQVLQPKLARLGIDPGGLGDHFDLVKSGLVNSLEFVELVASLEKKFQCEIDFEEGLEKGNLTTIGGLINAFENGKNG